MNCFSGVGAIKSPDQSEQIFEQFDFNLTFEEEHYEISQKIAEERLYPSIKNLGSNEILAANGTSCRHQIYDGTKIKSLHPISILKSALK